ncbi:MAG: alpha/beta fold hydrolase [Anaerolineae bacterium]|nr:alpha/beta fold hydrolase [Anaerolineae bacterium]
MIPILAEAGHRVIAMDHVGMGRSDKPLDPDYATYPGHVNRPEAFIQKLELDDAKLTIFVQDWGSLIGLNVIGNHPDSFERVVVGNGFLPSTAQMTTARPYSPMILTRTRLRRRPSNSP